ncbi:MAG: class I SAM-dependent methyltransferase [Candidatus Woesearchaeota archaeon]
MIENYNKIKTIYDEFHKFLEKNNRLPLKDTGIGYWGVTPIDDAFSFFQKIKLNNYKNFLDIGSGDGRMVLLASLFNVISHGIEYDDELVFNALDFRRKLGDEFLNKTKILKKDFLEHDMSSYDLIYISPDKPFYRSNLNNKLLNELKGKLIVHGWEFFPSNLKEVESHVINGEKFTIYEK